MLTLLKNYTRLEHRREGMQTGKNINFSLYELREEIYVLLMYVQVFLILHLKWIETPRRNMAVFDHSENEKEFSHPANNCSTSCLSPLTSPKWRWGSTVYEINTSICYSIRRRKETNSTNALISALIN